MNFIQILSTFIGRSVEVMVPNELLSGTLESVENDLITLEQPASPYGGSGQIINILTINIDFVRILA